ncbi:MAG TPA: tagaturonate epimerase family protein [Verrucomicrobiae bacterium]|nr:tagaturonate epimerase family protein [Verrucomicrobiae bacterium]
MLRLDKFSFGVGDRFAHQAKAQLQAFRSLARDGVEVTPVWNKSNREHGFIGSEPQSVFDAAQSAVRALGWTGNWHVDADHIRLETVDRFIPSSDFFTIDVADSIGKPVPEEEVAQFLKRHPELVGSLKIEGLKTALQTSRAEVEQAAKHYALAAREAGQIYRHIAAKKGADNMIAEVSMDETEMPQTPPQLLVILVLLAEQEVPVQTIAPKFTGRFNKGVDYVGDVSAFEREFNEDVAVLAHAAARYGLPSNLKLSVHSGSDKFSLYPIIHRALKRTGAGVHVKTAGTTWLEELIGLAESGGDGLALAKEIFRSAADHIDELCAPYASVIAIDRRKIPDARKVDGWTGTQFANALRHVPGHPEFNSHMRQLLHVSFKLAAKQGNRYLDLLRANESIVGKQVTENLYRRHLRPLFAGA